MSATFEVGDSVRLNTYYGTTNFTDTGVVTDIRTRPDGSPDYVITLDTPAVTGSLSVSMISRRGDALRLAN